MKRLHGLLALLLSICLVFPAVPAKAAASADTAVRVRGIALGDSYSTVNAKLGTPSAVLASVYVNVRNYVYDQDLTDFAYFGIDKTTNKVVYIYTNSTKWNMGGVVKNGATNTKKTIDTYMTAKTTYTGAYPSYTGAASYLSFFIDPFDNDSVNGMFIRVKGLAGVTAYTAAGLADLRQEMRYVINSMRAQNGFVPLINDAKLEKAAMAHSAEMLAENYFSDYSSDGRNFFERCRDFGADYAKYEMRYKYNGTISPAQVVHSRLKNAEGRDALYGEHTRIGCGISYSKSGGCYYTCDFGALFSDKLYFDGENNAGTWEINSVGIAGTVKMPGDKAKAYVASFDSGELSVDIYKDVRWSADDPSIIEIDKYSGNIIALREGETNINAIPRQGGKSCAYSLAVSAGQPKIVFDYATCGAVMGSERQIPYKVYPTDYAGGITWDSDDKTAVTVTSSGIAVPVRDNTSAVITASLDNGEFAVLSIYVVDSHYGYDFREAPNETQTINEGDDLKLSPTLYAHRFITTHDLVWNSSNEKTAVVDGSGVVTGLCAGTADITVTTGITGEKGISYTVKVEAAGLVKISKVRVDLNQGAETMVIAEVLPQNAALPSLAWFSDNPGVISVDSKGKIKGIKSGSARIYAATSNGLSASCYAVCAEAVTSVAVTPTAKSLEKGKTIQLANAVLSRAAPDISVNYSSSNSAVAKVSGGGLVTALKAGTATITVKTASKAKTAVCKITVTEPKKAADAGTGGAKSNSSAAVAKKEAVLKIGAYKALRDGNKIVTTMKDNTGKYQYPQIKNGSTLIPFRFVSNILGAAVSWDQKTKTVTVKMSGRTVTAKIGSKTMTKTANGKTTKITLSEAPCLINGSTYIPLRSVGNALGCNVYYVKQGSEQYVIVSTQAYTAETQKTKVINLYKSKAG